MSEKEGKPSAKSAAAANNQGVAEITSSNLKRLISHHDLTQKDWRTYSAWHLPR